MKYMASVTLAMIMASSAHAYALSVGGNGTIGINAYLPSNTNAGATTSGNVSTNADRNVSPVILITRADLGVGTDNATVSAASSVQSQNDLSAYASDVLKADTNADNADISGTAVSLTYKEPAELFGIIPLLVQVTTTVNASGNATVSYPWYSIFTTNDSALLQSQVQAATAGSVSANAGAGFSAQAEAQLLAQIHEAMKNHLQASLGTQAGVNASAQ